MKNIVISNISKINDRIKDETTYKSDSGDIIGIQTNEAPLKYFVKMLFESGEKVDEILTIVTKEAESALENLKNVLENYCNENSYDMPEIKPIEYKTDVDTITKLISKIKSGDNVYIDTTGGFRDTVYILLMVVRILEYSDIEFKKAIYSNYQNHQIEDVTSTYKMFNLITAANSFTSYGNSSELEKFFENSDNQVIKDTIAVMNEFSDTIALCKTSSLENILERLNNNLALLSESSENKEEDILFKSLANVIRNKFYMNDENKSIEYPDIVKWCVANNLIQQAVTIYTEKMPEYFYRKKYFTVSEKEEIEVKVKVKKESEKNHFDYYSVLFYSNFMISRAYNETGYFLKKICSAINEKSIFNKKSDEAILAERLVKSSNKDDFKNKTDKKLYSKYVTPNIEKNLSKFFRVKNAIYNIEGKQKSPETLRKNLEKDNIKDVGEYINEKYKEIENFPTTAKKFISSVSNEKKLIRLLTNSDEENNRFEDEHLNTIELIGTLNSMNIAYKVTEEIPTEQMQQILRDYMFIKTELRNKFNHASEESSTTDEVNDYFEKHGYTISENSSVAEISKFMNDVLNKLTI